MKAPLLVLCLILVTLTAAPAAEPRVFSSVDGKEIVAILIGVEGANARLQRTDGREFDVPIDRFKASDIAYINKWAEENKGKVPAHLKDMKPRLKIDVNNGRRSKKDDQLPGLVDERSQSFEFKIVVENEDAVYPIPKAKVTLMVTGQSPENGEKAVVFKQVFDDLELSLGSARTLTADPFVLWYDDIGAMYGFKYEGYFIFVEDPEGKFLGEVTNPTMGAKYLDAIRKLNAGDVYNSKYEKDGDVSLERAVKK